MMIGVLDLARRWGLAALLPALAFTSEAERQIDVDTVLRELVRPPADLPAGVVVLSVATGAQRVGPPLNLLGADVARPTWLPGGVVVVVDNDSSEPVMAGGVEVPAGTVARVEVDP